jgi:sodium/proline symporter
MDKTWVVAATLVAYKLLLVGIGLWARSRTRDEEDFFLGGRKLGPLVAAISYSSSASSAWTLLGVSGMAYVIGLPVVWIAGGSFTGMLVAWFWIGPRLMQHTLKHNQLTVTQFLAEGAVGPARRRIVLSASVIIIFSFMFYVAAQFQGAGNAFSSAFDLSMTSSILIGAAIIMVYTMLGGFWAVSVTDTVQGLLMSLTAILLPVAAIAEAGGWGGFVDALHAAGIPEQLSFSGQAAGLVLAGMVLGGLSISFGTYGQPHLLVRFMALRDERALRSARIMTIAWYFVVFSGMVLVGLAGHALSFGAENPENIFFAMTDGLFTPVLGAILLAAVLSAIMSTADSQLLVAASAVAHDLQIGQGSQRSPLLVSRLSVIALVVFAVLVALFLPEKIFSRVLFAWSALGAAFGPVVFLRLAGKQLAPNGVLISMLAGFGLSVALYLAPNTPGDVAERLFPFLVALALLWRYR